MSEFFSGPFFSYFQNEYGDWLWNSLYSVQVNENED